jgi:co-chaperonin GroES (HSP10)
MLETFLDVLLIEEIPVENDTATGIVGANGAEIVRTQRAARKPQTGKVISCDTRFPWYGMMVDMPYKVGDVVRTNEFGRDYIVLNPEDEFKPDATKFYLIHYADIQGRVERACLGVGVGPFTKERAEELGAEWPLKLGGVLSNAS